MLTGHSGQDENDSGMTTNGIPEAGRTPSSSARKDVRVRLESPFSFAKQPSYARVVTSPASNKPQVSFNLDTDRSCPRA